MLTVTRRFEFSYSHHLPGYNGACANLHGHNAIVEVTFAHGAIDTNLYPGMVVDFREINKKVGTIIDEFDHKNLNDLPEFDQFTNPTAENMALIIAGKSKGYSGVKAKLVSVRVSETSDSWATWHDDDFFHRRMV